MYLPLRFFNASNVILKRICQPVILSNHGRLSSSDKSLSQEEIAKLVKNNKIVIFMKGCPEQPMCGFSNAVVQILRMHNVQYDSHNILENESLRNGIKEYSKWPTIPQVFIDGQFVGGCDILLQMHQSGELIEQLQKAGITSALLSKAMEEKPK